MDDFARFLRYATAFEEVVADDDWSRLEEQFSEDAVYEVISGPPFAGSFRGREAVFAGLKASLDGLDRRFAKRDLELLDGPHLLDGSIWFRWRATYRCPAMPELIVDGEETITFRDEQIVRLEDRILLPIAALTLHWLDHYGDQLPSRAA